VFIDEAFPELHGRPVHFAGESFGGNYVPIFAATTRRKFQSIILVDPLINWGRMMLGLYEHLCIPEPLLSGQHRFNASACDVMEKKYSSCEKAAYLCELSYDADVCAAAANDCDTIYKEFEREVVPGGWIPMMTGIYVSSLRYVVVWVSFRNNSDYSILSLTEPTGQEQLDRYLNDEIVQHTLGFQDKFDYQAINMEFNEKWSQLTGLYVPTTREIAKILDFKKTPVLVLNGMNDVGM
jgi:cathepsin A (carboxypeptidase C)